MIKSIFILLLLFFIGCGFSDLKPESNKRVPIEVDEELAKDGRDIPKQKLEYLKKIEFSFKVCKNDCPTNKVTFPSQDNDKSITLEKKNSNEAKTYQPYKFSISNKDKLYLMTKYEKLSSILQNEAFDDDIQKDYRKDQKCLNSNYTPSVELFINYKSEQMRFRHYLNCENDTTVPKELIEFEKKLLEIIRYSGLVFDSKPKSVISAKLNQKIKVSIAEEVKIKDQNLSIKFVSVPFNNRCPFHKNVVCNTRGEAKILLLAEKNNHKKEITLTDNNNLHPNSAHLRFDAKSFGNYRIHLKHVPLENIENITLLVTRK